MSRSRIIEMRRRRRIGVCSCPQHGAENHSLLPVKKSPSISLGSVATLILERDDISNIAFAAHLLLALTVIEF